MYRVQLRGNHYEENEVGMHYQIHRGIGVHHAAAIARAEPLKVAIFVGGTPAMAVSAMMPLPEGLSELTFAGALAGHRIPMIHRKGRPSIYADADFVIEGTITPDLTKPEVHLVTTSVTMLGNITFQSFKLSMFGNERMPSGPLQWWGVRLRKIRCLAGLFMKSPVLLFQPYFQEYQYPCC